MVIIETKVFTQRIKELMSDDEYKKLQEALVFRPNLGDIIVGSGGLRKVRWKLEGRGKSGGVRVIYYWLSEDDQIYMVFAYPKSQQENLTKEQVKVLREIVQRWTNE